MEMGGGAIANIMAASSSLWRQHVEEGSTWQPPCMYHHGNCLGMASASFSDSRPQICGLIALWEGACALEHAFWQHGLGTQPWNLAQLCSLNLVRWWRRRCICYHAHLHLQLARQLGGSWPFQPGRPWHGMSPLGWQRVLSPACNSLQPNVCLYYMPCTADSMTARCLSLPATILS